MMYLRHSFYTFLRPSGNLGVWGAWVLPLGLELGYMLLVPTTLALFGGLQPLWSSTTAILLKLDVAGAQCNCLNQKKIKH
eukprot:2053792-Amphidinium_carterae.1